MKIATWNINSVRLRLGLIDRLMSEESLDVLCLQETKVCDEAFPREALAAMGFRHQHFHGMKSYNGVAILSRLPLANMGSRSWQERDDRRHIFATLPNGIEIHNFYVPAGGDLPDPVANPKFAHKLGFLDEMTIWGREVRSCGKPTLLVGDINVAPHENDVWSHRQMLGVVSHTPIEVEKHEAARRAGGWVDALRHGVPDERKLYSWWSYRASDWAKSDRGRRLDHVWLTPDLLPALKSPQIFRPARGWSRPSDHVQVIVEVG